MILMEVAKAARKVLPLKKCGAVIVAAGSASRMGGKYAVGKIIF